jgi:hypothetical protein
MALIVTGTLGAVALAGGLTALHCYRKLRAATETDSRAKWMAVAGIMNSILYLIVILASVAPPLLLQVCELSP